MKHPYRLAEQGDLMAIMALIEEARASLARLGIDQWQDGHPDATMFTEDIALRRCYAFLEGAAIVGVLTLAPAPEGCYRAIDGPGWLTDDDAPYAVLHRVAVLDAKKGSGLARGMVEAAEDLCREKEYASLRVDTHRGNLPMQGLLKKLGFAYCGEVTYPDIVIGDPIRLCFEKLAAPLP